MSFRVEDEPRQRSYTDCVICKLTIGEVYQGCCDRVLWRERYIDDPSRHNAKHYAQAERECETRAGWR